MRHTLAIVSLCMITIAATVSTRAQGTPAADVVETLHAALLGVMREADSLGFAGRRDRLAPVIEGAFELPLIARASTGRHWKKLDEAQRARLVDAFTRLTVATYAGRFDGYGGESFRIVSQAPAPRDTVLVNSELVKSDGDAVELDYLLRETDAGWRIIDVYLDGVYSELATRRSVYAGLIRNKGIEGLIAAIEDKIGRYESGALD
jgi:phospholipid transport system substrate-binding protein